MAGREVVFGEFEGNGEEGKKLVGYVVVDVAGEMLYLGLV